MRFSKRIPTANRNQGSAIVMVMILSIALMIILASQLDRGVSSKTLNIMNALHYEAKNAAESFAEYGCADIVERFESKTSFPSDELKTDPIQVPDSAESFYSGSNIDLAQTEVKGGQIEDGYWVYLDSTDPRWEFDPMKGKKIFVRDVQIYSKATAVSQSLGGKSTSAYVQQTLQVRDSPLFSNAIFYNLDLELNPGPDMNVYGSVHTNKDLWVGVNNGNSLKFHEPITATGRIYHGDKEDQNTNPHRSGLRGNVYMLNDSDSWKAMSLGGDGSKDADWLDSKHSEWRELSSQTWDGNVQDYSHNVPHYNAAGIEEHVPDDPDTWTDELENHAYALIEPLLDSTHPDVKSASVRNQKMMAKAGIIFKVLKDSSTETGFRIKAYKWARINSSVPVNAQNPFDGNLTTDSNGNPILVEVQIPDHILVPGLSSNEYLIGVADADIEKVDNSGNYNEIPQVEFYEDDYFSYTTVNRGLYDHRQDLEMSLVTLDMSVLRQVVDDNANPSGTNLSTQYWTDSTTNPSSPKVTFTPETDWNGVVYVEFPTESDSGGRTDKIVRAEPSSTVTYTETVTTDVPTGNYIDDLDNPIYQWVDKGAYNGTHKKTYWGYQKGSGKKYRWAYEFAGYQQKQETTQVTQTVTKTKTIHLGLQLINCEYIPSPTFCINKGLTVATNVPMYVVGHFNADGNSSTGDAQAIETNHYKNHNGVAYDEPPAALMADTITLLSADWKPANDNLRRKSAISDCRYSPHRDVTNFTLEVSAALVTGITPTIPEGSLTYPSDGAGSGGAINLPRFLEDWNGNTLTLRSSLVALFESEVHTEPYRSGFNHFYIPPKRNWGFNQNFINGKYPPGTPNVRSFRRTTFRDISESEYITGTVF